MAETSIIHPGLTRRAFVAGAALAAASLAIPFTPQKAFAWDSYQGFAENFGANPMHEDMTQIAYVRIVQNTTTAPSPDNVSGTLLYAGNDAGYKENVQYLRQGAFWNDCAVNTLAEFLQNFAWRYWGIPVYKKNNVAGSYTNAFDIADHIAQTQAGLGWMIPRLIYGRALVRFSMNKRGNLLHSMLGVEVDGNTYLSQKKQRELILQWLEAAYKYIRGDELVGEQVHVSKFFDPYGQLKAKSIEGADAELEQESNGDIEAEAESESLTGVEVDGARYDDADRKMTLKQIKLRAIGMMCHTIEDSYNPAHTIRSYCDPATSGANVAFGTILAFGNYETQSHHSDYDHIASQNDACADTIMRKEFIGGSATLEGAKSLKNVSNRVDSLYTLGLKLSGNAVYTFLTYLAEGKPWAGEVENWFSNTVFASYFTDQGSSYVYDGGRRAGNIAGLKSDADDAADAIEENIEAASDEAQNAVENYEQLEAYQTTLNKFYHRVETQPTVYYHHKDIAIEQSAFASAKAIIEVYTDIFFTKATAAEREHIKRWDPSERRSLYSAVAGAGGLIQEMSLDLHGVLEEDYRRQTTELLNLILANSMGEAVGSIEYVSDTHFALSLNSGGTMVCSYNQDTSFTGENKLVTGARDVKVSYTIQDIEMPTAIMTCNATEIVVPTSEVFFDSKGVVKSIDKNGITLDIEGSGTVPFAVASMSALGNLAVGDRISIDYSPAKYGFSYIGHTVLDKRPLLEANGTISGYYGDRFVATCGNDETNYGVPIEKAFTYSAADFIGALNIGDTVSVLYYDFDTDQAELQAANTADTNNLLVPYEASRIVLTAYEPLVYMYDSNEDGTHLKMDAGLDFVATEPCTNTDGTCPFCGYTFATPSPKPTPIDPKPATTQPLSKTGDGPAVWVAAAAAIAAAGTGLAASIAHHFRGDSEE